MITRALRAVRTDAQYRGSILLLCNTVSLAGFGFVFWTLAARTYPEAAVGRLAAVTAAVNLLATFAALGLPNTVLRHVKEAGNPRELVAVIVVTVSVLGGLLAAFGLVVVGPVLPESMAMHHGGGSALLVTVLVVLTAVGSAIDAGLIAVRAAGTLLLKNLVGSVTKIVALPLLADLDSGGLIAAYGLGTIVAALLGVGTLWKRLRPVPRRTGTRAVLRRYVSFSLGNYVGTVFGILPSTIVPLMVLAERGEVETAWFAVAFQLVGFLNFIPSTASQVMFAEARQGGLISYFRKAFKSIYVMLLPASLVMYALAPYLLLPFGDDYSEAGTGVLRVLALGSLLTAGNYLVDAALIARDHTRSYMAMNATNSVLVLAFTWLLLPGGLVDGAVGWVLAQGVSVAIGLLMLMVAFRHRRPGRFRVPVRPEREAAR
ncbi:oligosaccharide flippase family protein [Actinocorallia sp. API 0066]|uniref:oligosaccharide flippase family protein n=1 Tax=Actinocorallia sp. API 0066 TaxID=2896846 RepID=UPI001E2F7575|nr:oligosaccharide flippase family protein [Actinocorallia sp. API 0066]MCD0450136.1 oligosaccharide flippase family protein [Actinocorallia sp. API 0066]